LGGIGSGLILLVTLIIFVFPTPLARYLIVSELEEMGIDSTGLKTVRLDLWNSEIELGPIELWSQGSDPGQMRSAALVYDLDGLFHKELLIEALVVEGVDIVVLRDEEGTYTINGVTPAQFLEQSGEAGMPEEEGEDDWVTGVANLKIRNSHLLLQDYTGGTLALEVEELLLKDLHTWAPNEGGNFEIKMALNDIGLELQGEIRPFADPIFLSLRGGLRDATLAKVSEFTGPLGLARQEGVLDSDLVRDMYIHSDGRIEGASVGTIVITGVDIASEDSNEVQFEKAEIQIDTSSTIYPNDGFEYAGTINGTFARLAVQSTNGGKGSAEKIDLDIEDFSVAQRGERRTPHGPVSAGENTAARAGGVAPSLISQIVLILVDAVREILAHDLEFEASPSTTIEGINIALPGPNDRSSLDLKTASLVVSAPGARASTVDAGWRIDGALNGSVSQTTSTLEQDGVVLTTAVRLIDVASPRIGADTDGTDTAISFDVRTKFEDFVTSQSAADSPEAFDISFGAFEADASGFEVRSNPEGQRAEGPINATVDTIRAKVRRADATAEVEASGVTVALPSMTIESSASARDMALSGRSEILSIALSRAEEGGQSDLRFGATSWETNIAQLNLNGSDDGVLLAGQFDLALSTVEAQVDSNAMNVGSWETAVERLAVDTRNEALALSGELATTLAQIETEVMVDAAPLSLGLGRLKADLTSIDVRSGADDLSLDLSGRSTWENLETTLPDSDAFPGGSAALGFLTLDLREFAFSGGAVPAWRTRVDVELTDLMAQTSDESLFSLGLGGVGAKGLASDQSGYISVDEADFSALSLNLSDRTIALRTDDNTLGEGEARPASEDEAAPFGLRIGRLALAEGSSVQFTDTSVEPIARFVTSFKKAEVANFDTGAPSERTTLDVQAELNELSQISLSGWMAPLKEPLGFDIVGQVSDVALPDFSPYIAQFSGVNVETGQLTSDLSALTHASDLEGKLDLRISDLDLSSASDEATETFQVDYGVPIELAVGLLEDDEGTIALEFPIGGKIDAPKIDYSDVIRAALQGVLTAFFPSFDFGAGTDGVRLDPIVFSAGASELDDIGRSLSQRIAKLLNEKPKLSIKVCGKATAADIIAARGAPDPEPLSDEEDQVDEGSTPEAWTSTVEKHIAIDELTLSDAEAESLLGIAMERTSVARRYLIEDEGISEDRIGQCRVTYSMKDKKPPRVDVRF
jgi:hypothetical protein